jgi:predicted component of type VI protein secretion system
MEIRLFGGLSVEAGRMNADLVLLKKNGAHKTFSLHNAVTVLGRRHDCDLRIPLPTVSRRHCEIQQNGEALRIRDLDSTCGTFVNEKRVNGDSPVKAGDYIRIGPLTFVCQIDGKPEKIVPPKGAPPAQPKKAGPVLATSQPAGGLDDSFTDLDASDSAIDLDGLDSDLEDLDSV